MKRKKILTALILFLPFLAGAVGASAEKSIPNSSKTAENVRRPSEPLAVLANVKYLLDNHLFFDSRIYTDEQLKNVFGGTRIVWRSNDPAKLIWLEVVEFQNVMPPIRLGENIFDGVQVRLRRSVDTNLDISVELYIQITNTNTLNYDSVLKLFNTTWKRSPYIPSPHSISGPLKPHGEEQIFHTESNETQSAKIELVFNNNGNLYTVTISQKVVNIFSQLHFTGNLNSVDADNHVNINYGGANNEIRFWGAQETIFHDYQPIYYNTNDSAYDTAENILNGAYYMIYGGGAKGGARTPFSTDLRTAELPPQDSVTIVKLVGQPHPVQLMA